MNRLIFFFLELLSKIPLSVLYKLSDGFYIILYYITGYRKKVVLSNLRNSFPNKSEKEIKEISKRFYRNFSDYLIETIKSFTITEDIIDQHLSIENLEIFEEIKKEGKDAMILCGHVFNWEFLIAVAPKLASENTVTVYHRIRNPFWEKKILGVRSAMGTQVIDMKEIMRYIIKTPNNGSYSYLFIADQSPKRSNIHYSLEFLNQETPVFIGFDKIAVKRDMAVVYFDMLKESQGKYKLICKRINPDGDTFEPEEITKKFFIELEKTINKNPDNWLWTHKRWKFKKGIDY